ncbi:Uncharacterised protein [Escherichia coli]|nr:hypothetical protein A8M74_27175 [Escherichia coli]SQM62462.1 Uncharacterised protein [Escherichia coli]
MVVVGEHVLFSTGMEILFRKHEMVFVMPGAFVQSVLRIKKINYLFIIATVSFTSEKHLFVSFLLSEVFGLKKTGLVFLMGQFTSHRMNDIAKVNHYAKYN